MRTNVHHLVQQQAEQRADAAALTYVDTTLTYADLWNRIESVAAGLRTLGIFSDDRVAIFLEKRLEVVVAMFAASLAGAVFVPINPVLRPQQVAHILKDCDVRVLVTSPERLALMQDEIKTCGSIERVVLVYAPCAAPGVSGDAAVPTIPWEALAALEPHESIVGARIDLDMAAILYTSGSTGLPKGVVLSHRNLIVGAESVSQYLANGPQDVILSVLPLSFDAGLSQVTTGFSVGAHVVLMNYLLPNDVVKLCARHAVTGLTCVPPVWIQLADQTWPEGGGSLRYIANTGGRMPKTVLDKLRAQLPNATPFLMYGLTESFRSTYLDPTEIDGRPDSIGKAIPNAEILVLRPDGSSCEPGEEGELVHRGALVAMGYWNDPVRTSERFRPLTKPGDKGWRTPEIAVFSGDIVRTDAAGFLYFVGRRDEMIKTSGYRVSPAEIEEVVYETGLVRDAVAFGIEDKLLGQRIILVVSLSGQTLIEPGTITSAVKRQLPSYMVPSAVIIRDELPRSPNGKFDRALLRADIAL